MNQSVTIDRKRNCFRINFDYDDRRVVVDLVAEVRRHTFTAVLITCEPKMPLSREERAEYEAQAVKELFAWFHTMLQTVAHSPTADLNERVELSFLLTLERWNQESHYPPLLLAPIDHRVLAGLQRLARELAHQVALYNRDAGQQQRPKGNYFKSVRDRLVHEWARDVHANEAQIAFAQSVLGRAFAWKGGRIPQKDYDHAVSLRAGAQLILQYT